MDVGQTAWFPEEMEEARMISFRALKGRGGGSRLVLPASERRCLPGPVPVVIQYVRARRGLISDCVLLTAVPPHRQHAVSEWRFVSGADQR